MLAQKKVLSLVKLEETIKTIWIEKISVEICQNLVNIFKPTYERDLIAEIIKNKAYSSKYQIIDFFV